MYELETLNMLTAVFISTCITNAALLWIVAQGIKSNIKNRKR